MVINTNIYALASADNLDASQSMLGQSLERLSSGNKIITPSDDAAGLAVSAQMTATQSRVGAASSNVQSAISYVQTADGFLSSMGTILTRMSELTTMAKDVTKNPQDVSLYDDEFQSLKQQLQSTIGGSVYGVTGDPLGSFNGISLFGNTTNLTVTIGADNTQTMSIPAVNLRSTDTTTNPIYALLSIASSLTVSDTGAAAAVTNSIQEIASIRAQLGASESRLQTASTELNVQSQNLASAISSITDVDVATESTNYAKEQILVQSGTSMLAQANQLPALALKLLQS